MQASAISRKIFEAVAFIRHRLKAKSSHGLHSPLVYHLMTKVLVSDRYFYCFEEIENYRSQLLQDKSRIHVLDLGAGSVRGSSPDTTVSKIASVALQPTSSAQALFRLCEYFKPKSILELGTSLGITTAYLAKSSPNAKVITIEGSPEIAERARKTLSDLSLNHVQCITGHFDNFLSQALTELQSPEFVLIDGNHRYQPTIRYFLQVMESAGPQTIIVLDDIHWSAEMEKAWVEICNDSRVTASLDFFDFGVLILDPGRRKEHFFLRLI